MICIGLAAGVMALAAEEFTLSWTHSVARTRWDETWQASPQGLRPVTARIEGPGAGMELPDGAIRDARGWRYHPQVPPQREVFLAASGSTGAGWTLCASGRCHEIGTAASAPLRLWQADDCSATAHPP